MEFWKTYKIQNNIEIEEKKENINKKIFSNFKQLNLFLEILKEKRNIKIFSIKSDFVPKRFGAWYDLDENNNPINKNFYFTFSFLDLLKLLLFNILIYSSFNRLNKKFFVLYILASSVVFSLINFTRLSLILSIIYLINLAYFENIIKKYDIRFFYFHFLWLWDFKMPIIDFKLNFV